ncbi:MAG: cysteine synthase family protein [Bdellovibrionales bacterium]|nr:cysteine synthase family protein [Bdellovibrionales bacterium]
MSKNLSSLSVLSQVGNTPLVNLNFLFDLPDGGPTLLGKLEYLNPGGSIKDRSALYMVEDAERRGLLTPGGTIIEASSGNQGIALAMIGALKGYKVIITVPKHTSEEKVATLRAYGAEVHVCRDTDTLEHPESYHSIARGLLEKHANAFMPNQYFNTLNPEAHYSTTAPELWKQIEGKITHFISGMGSCGTISGIAHFLKEQNPEIQVYGVDSANSLLSAEEPKSYETEGIGVDVISDNLRRELIDEIFPVEDRDAFQTARHIAHRGLLLGPSSGAVLHVAEKILPRLSSTDVAVCILADSGRAYLGKVFSNNALFRSDEETALYEKGVVNG